MSDGQRIRIRRHTVGYRLIIVFVELAAMHRVDAEELRAFATAAGLLGIGHGIHTGAKNFAKRQDK
jgi:hypothetical protein